MSKKIATILILAILFPGIASAQEELPLNSPPGYFGSLTVNGEPAPQGTTITAKIGEEVRGSLITTKSGFYGDDPGPTKLWLTGYRNEIGSTVSFYVNGIEAQQTGILTGAETVNRVDLTFTGVTLQDGGTGSSTGGSGGGGVISAEPLANIESSETREVDLVAGIPVTYRYTTPQFAVYELVITSNISAGLTSAKIEQLKGTSTLAATPPPGTVYKNVNIWLGPSGFAVPGNIREGTIRFRINNSWLSGENIDAGNVSMMKWDGNQWISLETRLMTMDGNFAYYEALTSSFSPFAISGEKAVPAGTPGITPAPVTPTATLSPAPLAVMPPVTLSWILYAVVAIMIIAVAYYYVIKKRER